MAFRNLAVVLSANDAGLTSTMRQASSTVDEFGRRTQATGRKVADTGNVVRRAFAGIGEDIEKGFNRSLRSFAVAASGAYLAGRALNAGLRDLVGGAVQFDARMRNVNSISGLTEGQLKALGGQVIGLSRTLPVSANNLAEGLYDIASSGFQGAAGIQVLTAAAQAATAGLTDTKTSAAAIAGVLNAYGEGAGQAKAVSDSLFQTVNVGVLSFADLAQGIGQVVGTASAAGVNIDQLGAAIATMTRAGIVPAEAFTSLNQILSQIIKPSTALQALFDQLGYHSGAAALKAKGLSGVMEDIRRATGGDVTAMSGLFTDIRALRGAFALTTDQGQLYQQSLAAQQKAHDGVGQTALTLSEQLKSVSAQWSIFKNRVQAAAIETGSRLLPALLATMRAAGTFGDDVEAAGKALAPTFHNLADAAGSTFRVIVALASALAPLGRILAVVGFGALVGVLETLSAVVAAATGLIDRHRTAFLILGGVIATLVIPQMVSLSILFNRMILGPTVRILVAPFLLLARAIGGAAGAAVAARAAMSTLLATSVSTATVMSGVLLGALVAVGVAMYKTQQASSKARDELSKLTDGFDATKPQTAIVALNQLSDAAQNAQNHFNDLSRFSRGLGHFGLGAGAVDYQLLNQVPGQIDKIGDSALNTYRNASRLGRQLGVVGQVVLDYAAKNNVDLSKPWEDSSAAIDQVRQGLVGVASQGATSLPALAAATDGSTDAMTALSDAIDKAGQAAGSAFSQAFDVIQQFQPEQAAKTLAAAQKELVDSQKALRDAQDKTSASGTKAAQKLADYEAQLAGKKKISIAQEQKLRDLRAAVDADPNAGAVADARQRVADATTNLTKAQQDAKNTGDLSTIYANDERAARTFTTNINSAVRRGLDPAFVARLLKEGPEKAGPILDALAADHSGRLIALVNSSEKALSQISYQAVRTAQLTAAALNATGPAADRMAHGLSTALGIVQQQGAQGAKATTESIAKALHLTPAQVSQTAKDFGIVLTTAQQYADAHPIRVPITFHGKLPLGATRTSTPAERDRNFSGGGRIVGPGTTTSDSIPAWVSRDEWVVNAKASNYYGHGVMAALNKMTLPRGYAAGGRVGVTTAAPWAGGAGGSPQVIVQPVIVRESVTHQTNIGEVRAHNYDDFERQMRRRERTRRAVGG